MIEVIHIDEQDPRPEFAIIQAEDAVALWPEIKLHFEKALEYGHDGTKPEHVLARVLTGDLYLLVVTNGGEILASFTFERCSSKDGGSTLHCMTLAGIDMDQWVDGFIDVWKRLARELQCDRISIKGRKGWQRFALKKGFKHQFTIMYQEL